MTFLNQSIVRFLPQMLLKSNQYSLVTLPHDNFYYFAISVNCGHSMHFQPGR